MTNIIVYTDDGFEVHLNDGSQSLEEYEAKRVEYLGENKWNEVPSSVSAS